MKIIPGVSHLDHSLTAAHQTFILERFGDRDAFFKETVELPKGLEALPCSLVGPVMGDEPIKDITLNFQGPTVPVTRTGDAYYHIRGDRKWASRMVRPWRTHTSRLLTVIAGPAFSVPKIPEEAGESVSATLLPCVLYTAYGGPLAPREPGDPSIDSWEELQASRAFWSTHALLHPYR